MSGKGAKVSDKVSKFIVKTHFDAMAKQCQKVNLANA